jgi:mono/diheme cytochrome c family protein
MVAHAQPLSIRGRTGEAVAALPSQTPGTPATRKLFAQFCVKCHGADGTGKQAREDFPKIPNFTDQAWHSKRSDAQLMVSVLDGKGPSMPSFRERLSEADARALVAHVRAFCPNTDNPPKSVPKRSERQADAARESFESRFRALADELDRLREEFRALSEATTRRKSDQHTRYPARSER